MNKSYFYPYYLIVPGLLVYLIFKILPSVTGFYFAFTNLDLSFKITRFVWFENFQSIFESADYRLAIKNTLLFTVLVTTFKIVLGLALALFINQKLRTSLYLRSVIFFPAILSPIAVSLVFSSIFHPSDGMLNTFFYALNLDFLAQSWLTDSKLVMYSVSSVEIWKWVGLNMMLFLAGLQTISKETVESANLDGANSWQTFRFITLPLIYPVIITNVVVSLIGALKVFDVVYTLTGGGPGGASEVISTMVYKGFAGGRLGEAAAANMLLFIMVTTVVLSVYLFMNRKTEVD